jgi:hypothetical protein
MKSFWNLKKSKELKPRHSLWNVGLSARKPFKDSDKDKVIDIFDCQPHNRKKQGEEHKKKLGYRVVTSMYHDTPGKVVGVVPKGSGGRTAAEKMANKFEEKASGGTYKYRVEAVYKDEDED